MNIVDFFVHSSKNKWVMWWWYTSLCHETQIWVTKRFTFEVVCDCDYL